MKTKKALLVVSILLAACPLRAKTWYVSPQTDMNGWRVNGAGTDANPWDLQTALAGANGLVQPGDTVLVHGGTPYWGYKQIDNNGRLVFAPRMYSSGLNGSPGHPIIVKAYAGEHPVIDGNLNTSPQARAIDNNSGLPFQGGLLMVSGSYTWFWGLEIINSSKNREAQTPDGGGVQVAEAVQVSDADHIKLINLIIHDNTSTGIASFSHGTNVEIEGCLIYYNGFVAIRPPNAPEGNYKKNGPGIYAQNKDDSSRRSLKAIRNNVIFQQFYNGVQVYGSGHSFIQNFDFEGNTVFNNGLVAKTTEGTADPFGDYNVILGGSTDGWDFKVNNNQVCYFSPFSAKGNMKIGYSESHTMHHCVIDSNVFAASVTYPTFGVWSLIMNNAVNSAFHDNIVYAHGYGIQLNYYAVLSAPWHGSFSHEFASDGNIFLHPNDIKTQSPFIQLKYEAAKGSPVQTAGYGLLKGKPACWLDSFDLDKHSAELKLAVFAKNKNSALKVIATPDPYEPGLAKIVVFNWDSLATVNIGSLQGLVPIGNPFELTDIQDYHYVGQSTETYQGGIIKVKMAGLKTLEPLALGSNPAMVQPEHTDARFGVYWLRYFPYSLKMELKDGFLVCHFMDASGKESLNPPFLSFEWLKNGQAIAGGNSARLKAVGDGIYEIKVTDDKPFTKSLKTKLVGDKLGPVS